MWAYFGGVATLVPPSIERHRIFRKVGVAHFRLGVTSLLFVITSGYIYMVSYYQYLLYFFLFPFAIFAVTNCTDKGMLMSDRMQFLVLIKDDENEITYMRFKYRVSYLVIKTERLG